MANLKGSNFERQIYDAIYRTEARGTPRVGEARNDGLNHSHAIVEKRLMVFRDFANFATENGLSGKLNNLMTYDNVTQFLTLRTENLKSSTAEGYIANFSAMVKGLHSKNISIQVANDSVFFANLKDKLGRTDNTNFERGRYITETRSIKIIDLINARSHIAARLQYECGFRASEAIEISNNPEKYLFGQSLSGVAGKGGQHYNMKVISKDLANRLKNSAEHISRHQYYRDMKRVIGKNRAHDLRLSFAINFYSKLRDDGYSDWIALKKTSEEVNHHRGEMTLYYHARG